MADVDRQIPGSDGGGQAVESLLDTLRLDTLIAQTDAVAEAINAGDWESATELELERREFLQRYLQQEALRHGDVEHLRQALTELQARGNQFVGEVHHHRHRVIREACTLKKGRDAVKQYDSVR